MCVDPWWCHSWKGFNSSMRKVGGPVILKTYWWMAYVDVHSYSQKRFSWFSLNRATTAHESSIQNLFKSDHHSLLPKHLVCRHSMAGCGGFVIWIRQYEFLSTARSLPLLWHSSSPLLGGAQAQTRQWFEIFVKFLELRISECHFHPSNPRRPCLIPTRRSAKNWTAVPQCWVWWLVWLSKPWQARGFLNRSGPLTGPLCWIFLRWQHWCQEFSVDVTTLGQEVDLKWPAKQEWENNWKKQIKILVA